MLALTEPSVFADHWDGRQIPMADAKPTILEQHDVILICPETTGPIPHEVVGWKRRGLLPDTELIFGTYKGREYWSSDTEPYVAAWVVHARCDAMSPKHHFIPLALREYSPAVQDGGYVFVGGRKKRQHQIALKAVLGHWPATFVSDKLPDIAIPSQPSGLDVQWKRVRVVLGEYKRLMEAAAVVLVPLEPGNYPHGHSDVVRGFLAHKPVVVTAGASCDDYIREGLNGYLAHPTAEGYRAALARAFENLGSLTRYCRHEAWRPHTPTAYNAALRILAAKVLRTHRVESAAGSPAAHGR